MLRRPRSSRERRAPAFWRGGEVQFNRLPAGARARLDGEPFGAGLEDQRRGLLGAVDADSGAEHPAACAVATRLVRCQSEALAHYASTLAAARRAVNRKSELNELRAALALRSSNRQTRTGSRRRCCAEPGNSAVYRIARDVQSQLLRPPQIGADPHRR
jgi:hypothetical protein